MNEVRYDFDGLLQCARQMDTHLPKMILKDQWPEIEWLISIPESTWSGRTADVYRKNCKDIIAKKDVIAVQKLPFIIRGMVIRMREKEIAAVEAIEKAFQGDFAEEESA